MDGVEGFTERLNLAFEACTLPRSSLPLLSKAVTRITVLLLKPLKFSLKPHGILRALADHRLQLSTGRQCRIELCRAGLQGIAVLRERSFCGIGARKSRLNRSPLLRQRRLGDVKHCAELPELT